jgi:murein DD-endopeptidase MepM/ murein hydrolase activator NlpD
MSIRLLAAAGLTIALSLPATTAHAGDGSWSWPLEGARSTGVDGLFDAPDTPYSKGHRGVDLPGLAGTDVLTVAPGVVIFAGTVAGVGVVTVDHGSERSTYQPIDPAVQKGDRVVSGDVLGQLQPGPGHCPTPCLHLGRVSNESDGYLDPLDRLSTQSGVHLVEPDGPPPQPPTGPSGSGILRPPVGGPITSSFGMRDHPITGKHKLHDGADFGAGCRTPVRAAGDGVVIESGTAKGYGNRVIVRHSDGLQTLYGHMSRIDVEVGQSVSTSTTIGRVGSTGLSTGCHLHFGVYAKGQAVDPMGYL